MRFTVNAITVAAHVWVAAAFWYAIINGNF